MGNRFEIAIVGQDHFSKVFQRLNDSASRAVRPLTNTQRQMAMVYRELHIPQVVSGFSAMSRGAVQLASNLGSAAGPLQALFGLGAAGGVIAAVSAAVGLTTSWARAGFEINRTSTAIGISARELQRWTGAGELAGIKADVMSRSISSLAQTLQDAAFGRNPQALMMLSKLGIDMKKNSDGTIDTAAALTDLALALSRIADPQVRRVVAGAFGLEDALPLLMKGPEAIRALSTEADRLGAVMGGQSLANATRFAAILDKIGVAATGARNRIGDLLGTGGLDALESMSGRMNRPGDPVKNAVQDASDMLFGGPRLLSKIGGNLGSKASGAFDDFIQWGLPESKRRGAGGAATVGSADVAGSPAFLDRLYDDIRNGAQFGPGVLDRLTQGSGGGKVQVSVNVGNAPPGTTVTATSDGVPIRIGRSMALQ